MGKRVDYEKVERLHNKGLEDKIIASKLRCGKSTIAEWRKLHSKSPNGQLDYKRVESFYNQGLIDKEIAFKMDCNKKTIQRWRRRNNKPPHGRKINYVKYPDSRRA